MRTRLVQTPRVIVVMGVSGVGKTTLGTALAAALGYGFEDADWYHPASNVAKMAAGIPLDDDDRRPWLERLAELIRATLEQPADAPGLVLACSALKASYRELLGLGSPRTLLVYLVAPRDVLATRLERRSDHFMKAGLLDSQLSALEAPSSALTLDATRPVDELLEATLRALSSSR